MATHSSVLAWRIPETGEPGVLTSMGSHRVGHDRSDLAAAAAVIQLCLTLCHPMDCSPPGTSAHRLLQVRMMKWVAIPFSKGSSQPRDQTQVSHIAGRFFTLWATKKPPWSIYIWRIGLVCFHRKILNVEILLCL